MVEVGIGEEPLDVHHHFLDEDGGLFQLVDNLRFHSPLSGEAILFPDGSATVPSLGFISDPATGFYQSGSTIYLTFGGTQLYTFGQGSFAVKGGAPTITLGSNLDLIMKYEAANTLALINSINPQTFKLYETYTDANNYERYALIASGDQLEIVAQTLGTGADNLDIALTPAGTGKVKFGTYGAEVALVAGYITIKDAGGTPRKLAVIA